jgi:predicted ABC-type ATPase
MRVVAGPNGSGKSTLLDFLTKQTFTFETVMSGADKLDLFREAQAHGYRTHLYFICTDRPIINRERVAGRMIMGGRDIPADKIDARYERSLRNFAPAVRICSRSYLFDNSGMEHR